jgi:hypothetical protein
MKPPRIVYFLCLVTSIGLTIAVSKWISGHFSGRGAVLAIASLSVLALYFAFFSARRVVYDWPFIKNSHEISEPVVVLPRSKKELYRIDASQPLKFELNLSCSEYEADEKFDVEILDSGGSVVVRDSFVPVFGRFRLETQLRKRDLPVTIMIVSEANFARTIDSRVKYAELR